MVTLRDIVAYAEQLGISWDSPVGLGFSYPLPDEPDNVRAYNVGALSTIPLPPGGTKQGLLLFTLNNQETPDGRQTIC